MFVPCSGIEHAMCMSAINSSFSYVYRLHSSVDAVVVMSAMLTCACCRALCLTCLQLIERLLVQVTINYLLQWHVNWAEASPNITDLSMRWLYALMAQIEKPIALESSSQLSKLLRHCIKVRRQITDDNDIRLLSLHMLIALTGGYFGQDGTLAACMQSGWL